MPSITGTFETTLHKLNQTAFENNLKLTVEYDYVLDKFAIIDDKRNLVYNANTVGKVNAFFNGMTYANKISNK